jgi:hypothetical protein
MHRGHRLSPQPTGSAWVGRRTLVARNRTGPKLTVDRANEVLVGDGGHGDASRCVVPLKWAAVRRLAIHALCG